MASSTKKFFGSLAQFGLPILGSIFGGPAGAAIGGAAGGALSGKKGALRQAGIGAGLGYAGSKLFGGGVGKGLLSSFLPSSGSSSGAIGTTSGQGVRYPTLGGVGSGRGLTQTMGGDGASLFGNFNPQNLYGLGSLALGLGKQFPKAPEIPESVNQLRSQIQSGGSPLGQFSQAQLQGLMGQQFNPLSEPEIDASLRQVNLEQTRAEDQLRDLYRNIRPGTDPTSDATFRRDLLELQDQFARSKSDVVASRTRDVKGIFDQQRLQQIQLGLGADEATMNKLLQIAKLDVEQIQQQLDLDFEQARIFKETFLGIGQGFLGSGQQQSPLVSFNVGV